MTISTHLEAFLGTWPAVLWVEDMLTKEYLQRIWQPDDMLFHILIAGNNENVAAIVHHLQKNGYDHVFGLTDRDFRDSNRANWSNPDPNMRIYRPERLEIENYLLDWQALTGCAINVAGLGRTPDEIEHRATDFAGKTVWWMACRNVISDYHERLVGNFPRHPKVPHIRSLDDAENYITTYNNRAPGQTWWERFPSDTDEIRNIVKLRANLQAAHTEYQNILNAGAWLKSFSGKEIFREIRGYLFNRRDASPDVMDTDLAKSVAEWQHGNNSVPMELVELKDSIKSRLGLIFQR